MSTSLEQQAANRKERLAQLRNLKRKSETRPETLEKEERDPSGSESPSVVTGSGRNFDIENRAPKLGYDENPLDGIDETVEIVAEHVQKETLARLEAKSSSSALDLSNLQPKSVNWDLKRDLEPSMAILDRKTNDAIIKLVHQRLKAAGATAAD
ncbi:hypothetical protein AWJ20_421 [Sugiyamaella lignohabitans]|uniref:Uncharacterized protein n=1 Tax=Sugiyamaella lignohabitans TaxID=796027 RepID=A0A167CWF2_9ASCO|nr:uncharacterized protein AWJ20_421 [Sugiyamaella lignohabitans]ANB12183.1 hypothetical protein AWJ20_421 [Sugiyamaella lignohabitans]